MHTVFSYAVASRLPLHALLMFPCPIQGNDSANFKSMILKKSFLILTPSTTLNAIPSLHCPMQRKSEGHDSPTDAGSNNEDVCSTIELSHMLIHIYDDRR